MAKRPPLGAPAPDPKPTAKRTPTEAQSAVIRHPLPPSRRGKVQMAAYFTPDAKRQFDVFAAREGRSLQSIMEEMYDDFATKHGMHRLASLES